MKKSMIAMISTVVGLILGITSSSYFGSKFISQKDRKVAKFKSYYNMLNQWLILKQEGKSLEDYFFENGYNKIAIYGMGEMGNRLYDELKGSKIDICYAIDKNADTTYSEIKMIDPNEKFPEVDGIVVSAIFDFDNIKDSLVERTNIPIISLEDIIYES